VAHYGYLVDLAGVKLDDTGAAEGSWIQAMPFGTFKHPVHGTIELTQERAQRFADNVKKGVRGQDLNIDYDHKEGEAAGWVKDAAVRSDGLYLFVEWTKKAAQQIKEKAYRYFSPDFLDKWTHPSTQMSFDDVLCGGALTNRPFLKGILPVNLSEYDQSKNLSIKLQEVGVDPKKLRKLLGLAEDATDEQVTAALAEKDLTVDDLKAQTEEPPKEDKGKKEDDKTDEPPMQIAASEVVALAKKLSEGQTSPEVKQLSDLVAGLATTLETTQKTLAENQTALRLSEADNRVKRLSEVKAGDEKKGKVRYALPPAAQEKLRKIFAEAPKQLSDDVFEAFEDIMKTGLIELGERGSTRVALGEGEESASKQFSEKVAEKMKANDKLDYADAVTAVSAEDPELFDRYREETFAFREN